LGDAVQLTSVVKHLKHYYPGCHISVAALRGKHSAYYGLASAVELLDDAHARSSTKRDHVDQQVYDLQWPECATCYEAWPSTKAERCLLDVFGLTPLTELCRYQIAVSPRADRLARRYLEETVRVLPGSDGRYPVVLVHYEGNTSSEDKNLPTELARELCEKIIAAGAVPVILDWDRRSPLPDGKRIHNPGVLCELWGGTGTGDAEALAALTQLSSLMIGVDSGPLHVAGATSTPTIGAWTNHHPLHYFALADHVTHLVPEEHERLLRGNASAGGAFFRRHYRHATYRDLRESLLELVGERLGKASGALVYSRGYWVRVDNAAQDLVVVEDIAERDSYHIDELPMPRPVIVDVGAHIGCFSKRLHERNPLARIFAVECCPENVPALEKNIGAFATVIQAALTYEADVALLNAVFPNCETTGGSMVVAREGVRQQLAAGELLASAADRPRQYWGDLRPLRTMTLEELLTRHGLEWIDVLKLDCEGSEFSILGHTPSLERIGLIVGEYHGRQRFHDLVRRRFADWPLTILKEGELGTFWLVNPRTSSALAVTEKNRQQQ
jgi:FkbM family methyltransferase